MNATNNVSAGYSGSTSFQDSYLSCRPSSKVVNLKCNYKVRFTSTATGATSADFEKGAMYVLWKVLYTEGLDTSYVVGPVSWDPIYRMECHSRITYVS